MVLIGIGCSPVLMASYFIFARQFSPAVFGTLAGVIIGIGSWATSPRPCPSPPRARPSAGGDRLGAGR